MTHQSNPEGKPALTIVVQSWVSPLIGIVMLVVGLAAGYFGRPLLNPTERGTIVTQEEAVEETGASPTTASQPTPVAGATDEVSQIESQQQLMEFLVGQTVHFKGDANAPVTIIVFSDYQ